MNRYLVDTNIVIDLLLDREDADAACAVLDGAERGDYELFLCSLSFTNIYYSLRKYLTHEERISALVQLRDVIHVAFVDGNVIDAALRSGWNDFEDAVQYYTALSVPEICGIITRNKKDFRYSNLEVFDSRDFLK